MQRIICVLSILAVPVLLVAGDDDAVRKELKALQGTWTAVSLEAKGQPLPKEVIPEFSYTIGPDGKATSKIGTDAYIVTMTIDPKKDPKTIDNAHETGPQKGKKQYGVYKLEGNKLTVCMTAPGRAEADRPKDFDTNASANVVFVFERVPKDK